MAFPQVAAVNGGNNAVNSTEHTVNLPADISADDLLLVFFASDAIPTITFPGGWTLLFQEVRQTFVKMGVWYRVADGEEDATIVVTTDSERMSTHTSYRITGYSETPEAGTPDGGWGNDPDPLSLTPTWGAKDTLWFVFCGYFDGNRAVEDYPILYTDGRNDRCNDCGVGTARRERNIITEDPGKFRLSGDVPFVVNTIAIQPAAGWSGKVLGVTNPAKVMGVDVANIAKVHGVA